jgi:hypothetical protein
MKRVSGTKNSRTHQEPGDVFEHCFWPGDEKNQINTQGTCFENTDQAKVSVLGNSNSTNR